MYECLLWWMALPALLRLSELEIPEPKRLHELELQIESRMDAAEAAGYQVMALFELGESPVRQDPEIRLNDEAIPIEDKRQ